MRREGKYKVCPICKKEVRPGGIGAHMRLAHGVVVKTLVEITAELSKSGKKISHIRSKTSKLSGKISAKRPSDYIRKTAERVIKTDLVRSAFTNEVCCRGCFEWYDESDLNSDGLCWSCIHAHDKDN